MISRWEPFFCVSGHKTRRYTLITHSDGSELFQACRMRSLNETEGSEWQADEKASQRDRDNRSHPVAVDPGP
jgi:hypothetical protein